MARFRKKPVVIEAVIAAVGPDDQPDWLVQACRDGVVEFYVDHAIINTLEGPMRAGPTDMIIRGVKGELYPCKLDIFTATYEAVE